MVRSLLACLVALALLGSTTSSSSLSSSFVRAFVRGGGAPPVSFVVVDTRVESAAVSLAVQCAIGLENRAAPAVFNIDDDFAAAWLTRLTPTATYTTQTAAVFLSGTLAKYGGILYNLNTALNSTLLPSVVTLAGYYNAILIDATILARFPFTNIVVDTRTLWATYMDSVKYIDSLLLPTTTTLAFQDGEKIKSGFLVDYIVQQKMFVMYLPGACIIGFPENKLLHSIVDRSTWARPVRVYGYNAMDMIFGGYVFEAETNCVNVMGQVASANTNNLAFWRQIDPFIAGRSQGQPGGPLLQSPSPRITYNASKTYVALVYGDMDNIDFVRSFGSDHMNTRVATCSASPASCFPLTWTMSPNLIDFSPAMLRWFYDMAAKTGGNDWFIMPPSGTLYAYPGEMPPETQAKYVQQQNAQAIIMNSTGSIHWEWVLTWAQAWSNYFPRYSNTSAGPGTRGFFLNNVPWPIPILDLWLEGETFRWIGDPKSSNSVVGFKPAFNWMEGEPSGGLPYNSSVIAGMVDALPRGSVQYVYIIQNTNMTSVFAMASKLAPHVQLVGYQQLIDLARVAPPHPHA